MVFRVMLFFEVKINYKLSVLTCMFSLQPKGTNIMAEQISRKMVVCLVSFVDLLRKALIV